MHSATQCLHVLHEQAAGTAASGASASRNNTLAAYVEADTLTLELLAPTHGSLSSACKAHGQEEATAITAQEQQLHGLKMDPEHSDQHQEQGQGSLAASLKGMVASVLCGEQSQAGGMRPSSAAAAAEVADMRCACHALMWERGE